MSLWGTSKPVLFCLSVRETGLREDWGKRLSIRNRGFICKTQTLYPGYTVTLDMNSTILFSLQDDYYLIPPPMAFLEEKLRQ